MRNGLLHPDNPWMVFCFSPQQFSRNCQLRTFFLPSDWAAGARRPMADRSSCDLYGWLPFSMLVWVLNFNLALLRRRVNKNSASVTWRIIITQLISRQQSELSQLPLSRLKPLQLTYQCPRINPQSAKGSVKKKPNFLTVLLSYVDLNL